MTAPLSMASPLASLREQKKLEVRERILQAALSLMRGREVDAISADDIAAEAGVGRATFFRYFESKESALAVAFYEKRLGMLVEMLGRAPPGLGPMDTIVWTFRRLEGGLAAEIDILLLQGRATLASPALRAKAVAFQTSYEDAISRAVAPRFRRKKGGDLRPNLLAAAVLAVVRATVEQWALLGGKADLGRLMRQALVELKSGFGAR